MDFHNNNNYIKKIGLIYEYKERACYTQIKWITYDNLMVSFRLDK